MDAAEARALLVVAEEVAPRLRGLDRSGPFDRLRALENDLTTALELFIREQHTDEALSLTRALAPFWQATRRVPEATEWFERALSLPGGDDERRARACVEVSFLWFLRGDDEKARAFVGRAQEIAPRLSGPTVAALALAMLGRIALRNGAVDEARTLCLDAVAASGDDDPIGRASAAHVLGVAAQMAGDFAEARRWMSERIDLARADGNYAGVGLESSNLAMVERQLGDLDRAEDLLREALDIFHRRLDEWAIPFALNGLAAVALDRGDDERAATLIAAAEAMLETQGVEWPPDESAHYESTVAALERSLERSLRERAASAGRAMSLDDVVGYAISRVA